MLVVMGDSFLLRVRQLEIHVRPMVGNNSVYSGELVTNCLLTTTLTHYLRFINNKSSSITVFRCRHRHMAVPQTSPNPHP